MTAKKYVFLSYSSKDADFMKEIVGLLQSMNIEYWKAPEKIPAGSSYAKEINRAIENCSLFLLVLSQNSQESIWVEKEIDCALNSRRVIIPYNIDNVALVDAFKFYLNNVQMIFHNNSVRKFKELEDLLKKHILNTAKIPSKKPMHSSPTGSNSPRAQAKSPQSQQSPQNLQVFNDAHRGLTKRNLLKFNRVPTRCAYCGGKLFNTHDGVFVCENCNRENYDDYQKIENFLRNNGKATAPEIS
ncbi:MAG: toll/interleukin-1 receptor domain-containing protein, partial [Lachnospiraceae bacterium]|nr:toll/interleukin-1 receptor domain-containing protein [Lachnospiraceae bacterium]